jgi:putative DNA primase/helicase
MRITDSPAGWRKVKTCDDGGTVYRPADEPVIVGGSMKRQAAKPRKTYPTLDAAIMAAARSTGGEHVATWTYRRGDGSDAFHVGRFNLPDGSKQLRPVHQNGIGFVLGDPPGLLPLYRLPELQGASRVFVCEGEKAVDAARSIGLIATTSAHGSKCAAKSDWEPLRGKDVVILPDADEPGERFAESVGAILHRLNCTVRIVRLPDVPAGGDIVDLIAEREYDAKDAAAIRQEVSDLTALAEPWKPSEADTKTSPLRTVRLADVQPERLRWLWPARIPLGKLTLLYGDPGLGKSFLTMDLAARVSTGAGWPDLPGEQCDPGGVILLSAEDGLADTIRPRLDAAGADVTRIESIESVGIAGGGERSVNLADDLRLIEERIAQRGDVRLFIMDPISAYCGKADSHTNAEVRGMLAPIAKLAERHGVAIVAVSHLNKGAGGRAMYRAMGSLAFIAAARAGWLVVENENDPAKRLLLPTKMNLAARPTGLAFSLRDSGTLGDVPNIAWSADPVDLSADDALAAIAGQGGDDDGRKGALGEAMDFLRHELAGGAKPSGEVKKAATAAGIKPRTLDRARAELGVVAAPDGFGGPWTWALPAQTAPESTECAIPESMANTGEVGELCADGDMPEGGAA